MRSTQPVPLPSPIHEDKCLTSPRHRAPPFSPSAFTKLCSPRLTAACRNGFHNSPLGKPWVPSDLAPQKRTRRQTLRPPRRRQRLATHHTPELMAAGTDVGDLAKSLCSRRLFFPFGWAHYSLLLPRGEQHRTRGHHHPTFCISSMPALPKVTKQGKNHLKNNTIMLDKPRCHQFRRVRALFLFS